MSRFALHVIPIAICMVVSRGNLRIHIDDVTKKILAAAIGSYALSLFVVSCSRIAFVASTFLGTCAFVKCVHSSSEDVRIPIMGGLGCVANLIPIVRFGAMPVSPDALGRLGVAGFREASITATKHVHRDGGAFSVLGDSIPIQSLGIVASIGDLIIAVAFVALAFESRRRSMPKSSSASPEMGLRP